MRRIGLAFMLTLALLAGPLAVGAQQAARVPRIGILVPTAERQIGGTRADIDVDAGVERRISLLVHVHGCRAILGGHVRCRGCFQLDRTLGPLAAPAAVTTLPLMVSRAPLRSLEAFLSIPRAAAVPVPAGARARLLRVAVSPL